MDISRIIAVFLSAHCGRKCWYGSDGSHIHNGRTIGDAYIQYTWDATQPEWLTLESANRKTDVHLDFSSILDRP